MAAISGWRQRKHHQHHRRYQIAASMAAAYQRNRGIKRRQRNLGMAASCNVQHGGVA